MEEVKLNFVSNGVANLPPGFQFEPTDEEIVFEYLKCKVLGLPLPAAVIPEINVREYDPWDLPGEVEKDKYFFCSKKMNVMSSRGTCSGHWKCTGEERLVLSSTSADKPLIGLRKTMVFFKGNMSSVENKPMITEWKMHEYHMIILTRSSSADSKSHQSLKKLPLALGGWSICHILKKKKKNKSAIFNYALTTLNKRIREDSDIDSSNDSFKLSKLDHNGGESPSSSSFSSWSSDKSSSSISGKSSSSDDTEESCTAVYNRQAIKQIML